MRIGIYGNDNNVGLIVAEALRRLRYTTKLVLTRTPPLHRPEACDARYRGDYPWWIHDASSLEDLDYACSTRRLHEALCFLDDCDLLFLNHVGPSLASLWQRPYVCLLTGSDLNYYASYATLDVQEAAYDAAFVQSASGRLSRRTWQEFISRQRAGIAGAPLVIHPARGLAPNGDLLLDELGVPDSRRDMLVGAYGSARPPRRTGSGLRVLSGARHIWKRPLPPGACLQDDKGNDVLIAGFAEFVRARPDVRVELVLVDKGHDVAGSKALVAEHRLESLVRWLPELPLHEFLGEVAAADIVVDHFGPAIPGMCAWSGMLASKPVIANFHPDTLRAQFGEAVPGCHATSPAEVAAWLARLAEPSFRQELALNVRRFADRHLDVASQIQRLLARFESGTHDAVGAPAA